MNSDFTKWVQQFTYWIQLFTNGIHLFLNKFYLFNMQKNAISSLHNTASKKPCACWQHLAQSWWFMVAIALSVFCFSYCSRCSPTPKRATAGTLICRLTWLFILHQPYSNVRSFGIDLQSSAKLLPIATIIRTLNNTRSVSCRGSCIRTAKHDEKWWKWVTRKIKRQKIQWPTKFVITTVSII